MTKVFRITLSALAAALIFVGCSNTTPRIESGITPAPTATVVPSESVFEVTHAPEDYTPTVDALGNVIQDPEHYRQYIQFTDLRVYEENEETFLDCIVTNSYPYKLTCSVSIRFFDENDETIATATLQMPNGSFLLTLENGETPLYARILTDTSLTDNDFELIFDPGIVVEPIIE